MKDSRTSRGWRSIQTCWRTSSWSRSKTSSAKRLRSARAWRSIQRCSGSAARRAACLATTSGASRTWRSAEGISGPLQLARLAPRLALGPPGVALARGTAPDLELQSGRDRRPQTLRAGAPARGASRRVRERGELLEDGVAFLAAEVVERHGRSKLPGGGGLGARRELVV